MPGEIRTLILLLCSVSHTAVPGRTTREENYPESELIALAKAAVRAEVGNKPPATLAAHHEVRPVFVTIESHGKVLGCRGTLVDKGDSLEAAVVDAARNAAAHDPRYRPILPAQLNDFQVTVTVVERLEPLASVGGLEPKDGLVLTSGSHIGIVLPWEGTDSEVRLKWAYQKAAVPVGSGAKLQRLVAKRFKG